MQQDIASIFTEENAQVKEQEFYSKPFNFSYSSLNKLMWNPVEFYTMYVLGLKEEKTAAHLLKGKIIHALILEEEKFKEYFAISPTNLPKDKAKIVIDRVFAHHNANFKDDPTAFYTQKLSFYPDLILDIMKDIEYFQNLKTDQQRLEKIITYESGTYWDIMLVQDTKTVIDQDTYEYCKSATDVIKMMPTVNKLLGLSDTYDSNVEVFNELYLQADLKQYPFGIHGILDNLKIDHTERVIYVNDLKTTNKSLKDFQESIDYYQYWLQACMYLTLVSREYMGLIDQGYELRFHFIVIDPMFSTYAFPVTEKTLSNWHTQFLDALKIAEYHYTNRRYELPYAFDKGLVQL
jgi:hypothetical protein